MAPEEGGYLTPDKLDELAACRQGDVLLFNMQAWLAGGDLPTTERSLARREPGKVMLIREAAPNGVAVLTQTCDLVPRKGRHRDFIAVAPLVELPPPIAVDASRRRRPQFAHLPSYKDGQFFVDLDRITTVEVGLLVSLPREHGLSGDKEQQVFGEAVARKFGRFAFPDELPEALARWRDHVVSKHDKEASPEGTLYRQALDVRIKPEPSWAAVGIDVVVFVIFPPGFLPEIEPGSDPQVGGVEDVSRMTTAQIAQALIEGIADPRLGALYCDRLQSDWSGKCTPNEVISSVRFELVAADEMTVDQYLSSYSFDLEFLTESS